MISHIDVSSVLKRSVCDLYSNLVTRPTGAAVRIGIEHHLDEIGDKSLAVLDFSHVGLLDFSCADEIVAKLLMQYVSVDIPLGRSSDVVTPMSGLMYPLLSTSLRVSNMARRPKWAVGYPPQGRIYPDSSNVEPIHLHHVQAEPDAPA